VTAQIIRRPSTDEGTFGVLLFGGVSVRTVELPWRGNARQRSCIPPGKYLCEIVNSPRFGRVYGLRDVPGRSHVLIHAANLAGDVDLGWDTQLHGCIAPVERFGVMQNKTGKAQRCGLVSRPALRRFTDWAAGKPFELEITWQS
jgi:hypothetical protein